MTDNYRAAEAAPADPHAGDPNEDPEQHVGEPIQDPWDDPGQTDWETHSVDLDAVTNVDPSTAGV